jgi:hypothetical protein
MAIINYKEGDDPTKNKFGIVSGVDLTSPPILNEDPSDIESVNGRNPEEVFLKWEVFYKFLQSKTISTDINSLEGRKKISLELINEFNTNKKTSFWASSGKSISNPLTKADIEAIQRFTQKTDPNVQVDGWVGTQTIQLKYPPLRFLLTEFRVYDGKLNKNTTYTVKDYPSNTVIPIIWGNKRFVIPLGDFNDSNSSKTSSYPFWKSYDPIKDKNNLPWNSLSTQLRQTINNPYRQWDELDNTVNNENALSVNQKTNDTQQRKNSLSSQSKLVNSIK